MGNKQTLHMTGNKAWVEKTPCTYEELWRILKWETEIESVRDRMNELEKLL